MDVDVGAATGAGAETLLAGAATEGAEAPASIIAITLPT